MKKKSKIFIGLIALMLFIPLLSVKAESEKKVKVYMFEAGGCPACNSQEEYLKGLDSYGKKFELIKEELYVDHVDWELGRDYDLGVKVATGFKEAGFDDATYEATPFVVVSDVYAASGYNMSLETVINEVYEKGDKDVVGCYAKGETDCLKHLKSDTNSNISGTVMAVTIASAIVVIAAYLIKSDMDKKEIIKSIENNRKTNKSNKKNN